MSMNQFFFNFLTRIHAFDNDPEAIKLYDEEKEFCRLSRIQPTVYLRVKQIIILECNKVGHVTYSRARKIASIDVNKTRKIHNFLLHLNLIKANCSSNNNEDDDAS